MRMDASSLVDLIQSIRKISISLAVFFVFLLLVAVGGAILLIVSSQIEVDAAVNLGVGITQIVFVCLAAVMFISVMIVWAIVRNTGEKKSETSAPSSPPSETSVASDKSFTLEGEDFDGSLLSARDDQLV